jgi:hypothetical protein
MCKNTVNADLYILTEPRKISTLPAVYAQTIEQNKGQPLQKMVSYSSSTSLVFNFFVTQLKFSYQSLVKSGSGAPARRAPHRPVPSSPAPLP